jgi:hypothetical protein
VTWDPARGLYAVTGLYNVSMEPRVTDMVQVSGTITPFQAGAATLHVSGSSPVNGFGQQQDVEYRGTVVRGPRHYVTTGQLTDCFHPVGQACGAPVMTGPATFV